MTDIVEMLRMEMRGDRHADLAREAADEIERLRATVERMSKRIAELERVDEANEPWGGR